MHKLRTKVQVGGVITSMLALTLTSQILTVNGTLKNHCTITIKPSAQSPITESLDRIFFDNTGTGWRGGYSDFREVGK